MIIAVLFNSDDPKFNGFYGPPICDLIFGTSVLQSSGRHMKISHGDVLIGKYSKNQSDYERIAEVTFFSNTWSRIKTDRIRSTYMKETVWAWVIQNATHEIAEKLDLELSSDSSYLGLHAVDYSQPVQLVLYRNLMPHYCRIHGAVCTLPYSMGNLDEKNEIDAEHLLTLGFSKVEWEDLGAQGTIFDNYDNLEHFQQVRDVQRIFSDGLAGGDYEAEEMVMFLEDVNPRLFYALGAAVRVLKEANNEENFAQIGLSARRYLEQLADVLFPPRPDLYNGKKVTVDKHKNRIWAFIADAVSPSLDNRDLVISRIGNKVDRLFSKVNSILHSESDRASTVEMFIDIAKLSIELFQLDPAGVRRPYDPYKKSLESFLLEALDLPSRGFKN
jgi:hypothetical protein